jgi:glycosyltransferase involved in cell wall biosynthesis
MNVNHNKHICILLGTFNGEKYLKDQLDSFIAQTYGNWSLWVSDDGSKDRTKQILTNFITQNPSRKIRLLNGPQGGFVRNYLYLLNQIDPTADLYAFSDQDDIWLPSKLERSIKVLSELESQVPGLYCSRTILIDQNGQYLGLSKKKNCKASFANAIIQNLASGNTMVFNQATLIHLKMGGQNLEVHGHDWWTYLTVTAVNGVVHFDNTPTVKYRQHCNNQIGATYRIRDLINRGRLDLNGQLRMTIRQNLIALHYLSKVITDENNHIARAFTGLQKPDLFSRVHAFMKLRSWRQTFFENIPLFLSVVLRRI